MHKEKALIIFAKAPVAGKVKTRLIPYYSPAEAALIHQQLLEYAVANLVQLPGVDVMLHCAPDQNHHFFKYLEAEYNIKLDDQPSGDLGHKMSTALSRALLEYKKVVLIGADIPAIDIPYIESAFEKLEHQPTVIGPAEDGGYVLVGLTQSRPAMFEGVEWGSSKVLQQTIEKLQPEMPVLLDTLWDVDRAEDVERFLQLRKDR
ncbi:MAG: TIGR04282 family arsenosugar biosynthesis glycosyltransferase [Gammaproteobacteria bacterium]|nr:TIGR04282 family arsenosugar biosynthesis glycosyltransferase [Gammaproteobacteria bacterium]